MTDVYQARYLAHQARKTKLISANQFGSSEWKKYSNQEQELFFEILNNRTSQRTFNKEPIDIIPILKAINTAPSSCSRKGINIKIVEDRDHKDLLSGLLVGGVGWINRADKILLLVADMNCYKNPAEQAFMPYLDAGVIIQTAYLTSETLNYGCCFVNPNIREANIKFFKEKFGITDNLLFCGAIALGHFDLKHTHTTEQNADYYNEAYKEEPRASRYDNIYKEVGEMVGDRKVLDVGCGTGELQKYVKNYTGFDFSSEAIKLAGGKTWIGDAYDKKNYEGDCDVYLLLEILEHLDDLKIIQNIPSGKPVIFSVPSFKDYAHIRLFTKDTMTERYKDIFDIKNIIRFNLDGGKWNKNFKNTIDHILLVDTIKK